MGMLPILCKRYELMLPIFVAGRQKQESTQKKALIMKELSEAAGELPHSTLIPTTLDVSKLVVRI